MADDRDAQLNLVYRAGETQYQLSHPVDRSPEDNARRYGATPQVQRLPESFLSPDATPAQREAFGSIAGEDEIEKAELQKYGPGFQNLTGPQKEGLRKLDGDFADEKDQMRRDGAAKSAEQDILGGPDSKFDLEGLKALKDDLKKVGVKGGDPASPADAQSPSSGYSGIKQERGGRE